MRSFLCDVIVTNMRRYEERRRIPSSPLVYVLASFVYLSRRAVPADMRWPLPKCGDKARLPPQVGIVCLRLVVVPLNKIDLPLFFPAVTEYWKRLAFVMREL